MKVTGELRAKVLMRDRVCFYTRLDRDHQCRDQWGYPHASDAVDLLTLDHVKDEPQMGKRAPSDEWHLVAMCWAGNVGVPSKEVRQAERAYLATLRAFD